MAGLNMDQGWLKSHPDQWGTPVFAYAPLIDPFPMNYYCPKLHSS